MAHDSVSPQYELCERVGLQAASGATWDADALRDVGGMHANVHSPMHGEIGHNDHPPTGAVVLTSVEPA